MCLSAEPATPPSARRSATRPCSNAGPFLDGGRGPNNESRVLGLILRALRREGTYKLLVSFADPSAGHVGTIYQASGWTYLGTTDPERYFLLHGVRVHSQ